MGICMDTGMKTYSRIIMANLNYFKNIKYSTGYIPAVVVSFRGLLCYNYKSVSLRVFCTYELADFTIINEQYNH